ncbi:MAG: FG-GAP repeat domain-containing protein [Thermoanaerobaculia bacterium]
MLAAFALLGAAAGEARDRAPGFLQQSLELPGIPAAVLPADMDGDGIDDLVVLVAHTGWTTRSEFAPARFDDVEGLVEVMNVVDELVDRRELRLYPGLAGGGGFGSRLAALDLDTTVHALAAGHPAEPLIAITDSGAAAVRLAEETDGPLLTLTPLVSAETSFAGGARFYPVLDLLHDIDGDGLPELLLPTAAGWAVYRGLAAGIASEPAAVIPLPDPPPDESDEAAAGAAGVEKRDGDSEGDSDSDSDSDADSDRERRLHDVPFELRDCNGDGRLDFVVPRGAGHDGPLIFRRTGGLSFATAVEILPAADERDREVMYVGDLDDDGRAEAVDRTEIERYADPGWRQEVDEAKRPLFAYAVRRLGPDLTADPEEYLGFQAIGYTFGGTEGDDDEAEIRLPGGFQDLDGDGRQDLVAITLEFSVLPLAMRVLVVKRISLTMNFHVWCQAAEGGFREVPGLDLAGKFKLNLENLRVRHLSQFAGDFDADGRADFVQLGRGKKVTIHQGRAGCRYPVLPDRTIKLARKLRHLGLARILDLDGDRRSDLYVVHPLEATDEEVSIPARVDLYLSRF